MTKNHLYIGLNAGVFNQDLSNRWVRLHRLQHHTSLTNGTVSQGLEDYSLVLPLTM